jgi:cytochrome c oxidase subunit I
VTRTKSLALFHFVAALAVFVPAIILGFWQMLMRSPLPAPMADSNAYYASVTAHGSIMAYVFPTFFAMGFGYVIVEDALKQTLIGLQWAWSGFWLCVAGSIMAVIPIAAGRSSVLYTFYPPLVGSPFFYLGVVLVILGSYVWVVLMLVNFRAWKREHPGEPVPLPMFAIAATALLWGLTALGVSIEVLFLILPAAFGWTHSIDPGLSRTLFSFTLHAIVYFWLLPAYIAYYTILPRAAGGRLYSDTMGRIAFILFLVFSLPVGLHHLFMDPEHGSGFKFVQSVLTFFVALPTLLTVYSITASLEVAGRARGGKGVIGWIRRLPWDEPMVLAVGLSLIMLGLGGFGGLVNMSYAMNAMIHNTSWVTAHFHLIYGGAVVIVYFAIYYHLWPRLTGRALISKRLACRQLWLWCIGMLVTTIPWHITGLMGQPRRYSTFDYSDPFVARMGPLVVLSVIGGFIIVLSVVLFCYILVRSFSFSRLEAPSLKFAVAVNPPTSVPAVLNGFGFWTVLTVCLICLSYGYPIAEFFMLPNHNVPVNSLTREMVK